MKIRCAYDKLVPISELKPHPKNRNDHPQDQIVRLAKVLAYQGWRYPVKVSLLSGFVTSGHGRIEAAKKNGWLEVPVNFQEYESTDQEYADLIADNSVAAWSELDLSGINADLADLGPDFDIDLLGLKDFEIEMADKYADQDPDEIPEIKESFVKPGDVWILGSHRLMCGDSTQITDVEKLMAGDKADMTFTSPPYNLGISSKLSGNTKIGQRGNAYDQYDDNQSEESWLSLVANATQMSLDFSRYCFWNIQPLACNRKSIWKYAAAFADHYCDVFVWDKIHAPPQQAERVVNSRFEFVWCFTSDENPTRSIRIAPQFRGTIDNVFTSQPQRKNDASDTHGATFPCYFPEHFINSFCPTKGSVIDLFGGSGTTLIASEKTNRKCFTMELSPHYCGITIERWQKFTGQKAHREDGTEYTILNG